MGNSTDKQGRKSTIRATFLADPQRWEQVKTMAIRSGMTIRDTMDAIIALGVQRYEEVNGSLDRGIITTPTDRLFGVEPPRGDGGEK